ncbi:MAG: MBOAT family protein [Sulfuricella denitrificans]|nr:MBOAT family protein [Sulfuricella denitrificans]
MLFNSYPFIFLFLPATLWLFFRIGETSHRIAAIWLVLASLFFYSWWNPSFLGLLLLSVIFNYSIGLVLTRESVFRTRRKRKLFLVLGICGDLALLFYFKYAGFLQEIFSQTPNAGSLILPLGISFFTFTQIAFLVDAFRGEAREPSLPHYALFVSYFPHLIAGPILHHRDIMPQFASASIYRFKYENIAVGLTIFAIGLFKKTVLADGIAPYATPLFDAAGQGMTVTLLEAWGGALAYTLQLYFDFSGYSDMAIGASRLFGIRLPLNFHSPYKASNIIEFWRRWHMTLSRFLRDYLYIPLGGNRHGKTRRYLNLMATMLLGGLWHGAGWTFVVWGGLHGLYLAVNHAWRNVCAAAGLDSGRRTWRGQAPGVLLTFLAVVVAWVIFRATSLDAAWIILQGMAGENGLVVPVSWQTNMGRLGEFLSIHGASFGDSGIFKGSSEVLWITVLLAITWTFPNTQQFMARFDLPSRATTDASADTMQRGALEWQPVWPWAIASGFLFAASILSISKTSEFLYFQF